MSIQHLLSVDDPYSDLFNIGCTRLVAKDDITADTINCTNFNVTNFNTVNINSTGTSTLNIVNASGLVTTNNLTSTGTLLSNNLTSTGILSANIINGSGNLTIQNTQINAGGIVTGIGTSYYIGPKNMFAFPKQMSFGGTYILFPFPVGYTDTYLFPYSGLFNTGRILSIKVAMGIFTKSLQFRVIDVTNSDNIIAESIIYTTPNGYSVADLGIISNLPNDYAVFNFQVAVGTGLNTSQVGGILINYEY